MSAVRSLESFPPPLATSVSEPHADAQAREILPSAETLRVARTQKRRSVMLAVGLLIGLGGTGYWYSGRGLVSTDNAQVDADVIAVPSRIGGVVAHVYFEENQAVPAGALLAELDPAPFAAQLAQVEAQLVGAQASADAADADAELSATKAVGNRDIARANLQTNAMGARASSDGILEGEAQVQSARARLAQAKVDFERARSLFDSGAFTKAQLDAADTAQQVAATTLAAEAAHLSTLKLAKTQSQSRVVEASAQLRVSDSVDTLVRQARARAAVAHAQVDTAKAARDRAALDLGYTKIFAPRAGCSPRCSASVRCFIAPSSSRRWSQMTHSPSSVCSCSRSASPVSAFLYKTRATVHSRCLTASSISSLPCCRLRTLFGQPVCSSCVVYRSCSCSRSPSVVSKSISDTERAVCGAGSIVCGTTCVNPSRDEANCGGCGKACAGNQVCLTKGEQTACVDCGGLGEACCDPGLGFGLCRGGAACGPNNSCVRPNVPAQGPVVVPPRPVVDASVPVARAAPVQ